MPAEFIMLDSIPLLGSGKPDYVAAQRFAAERATPPRVVDDTSEAA